MLDTHIWLWSVLEPARLSDPIAKTLSDPANELWVSPISSWEILTLQAKGRLKLEPNGPDWVAASLRAAGFREAPLTNEVVLALAGIETPHRDPADRFLAATAATFGLTLVTSDENLIQGRGYSTMPNN